MEIATIEHRSRRRVEFFLMPVAREQIPVWVFKPTDALQASAGLVLNMSDGGLQVLTAADDGPKHSAYEMQLLLGEDETVARFRGRVSRVWTRHAETAGWLSGLRFEEKRSPAHEFLEFWRADATRGRWLRCLLIPVTDSRGCEQTPVS